MKQTKTRISGKTAKVAENPFDKFANPRKKHDVLNRKVKGEDRNVGKARGKAIEARKVKLMSDYKSITRNNSFVDKRFGENDPSMSLEEKAFLRLQREKQRSSKKYSAIFNLEDEDTEVLTHGGSALGASNVGEYVPSDDDDANLDRDVVNSLHFGGGLIKKERGIHEEDEPVKKHTHLDALQEIVAKSKLHKLERKEAKEEQEDERLRLDAAFESMLAESVLQLEEKTAERYRVSGEVDEYDTAVRQMAYETRVQPSDRIKTPEELALEAKEKLEELERARLERMRGVFGGVETKEELSLVDQALGDGKKKAAKRMYTDDEDPFYEQFAKTKGKGQKAVAEEEEEEDDWEEDEAVVHSEEEESEEESEEEDDDAGEEESDNDDAGEEEEEEEEVGALPQVCKTPRPRAGAEEMPHKLSCPSNMMEFDEMIEKYVKRSQDMNQLVERILIWNSVKLPGTEGQENKAKMHNFLDILIKHFIRVGDSLVAAGSGEEAVPDTMAQIHALGKHIHRLTGDLQPASSALWRRTIRCQFVDRLQKKMRDYVQGEDVVTCFPSFGRLLLMRLVGNVFSVSDAQHSIVTPMVIFMAQTLVQCPINTPLDLSCGLFVCALLLDLTQETNKWIPEIFVFLRSVLSLYHSGSSGTASEERQEAYLTTVQRQGLQCLRSHAAAAAGDVDVAALRLSWLSTVQSMRWTPSDDTVSAWSVSLLHTAYALIGRVLTRYQSHPALPELMQGVILELQLLRPHTAPALRRETQEQHLHLLEALLAAVTQTKTQRSPLTWRVKRKKVLDSLTPRYQMNYSMTSKEPFNPNKEKALAKVLNKQLKREQKAAMRELRRDSDYIEQQRFEETMAVKNQLREERLKNFSMLEQEQGTINQQVKQGKGLMKGGGSGVAKKPRIR